MFPLAQLLSLRPNGCGQPRFCRAGAGSWPLISRQPCRSGAGWCHVSSDQPAGLIRPCLHLLPLNPAGAAPEIHASAAAASWLLPQRRFAITDCVGGSSVVPASPAPCVPALGPPALTTLAIEISVDRPTSLLAKTPGPGILGGISTVMCKF